MKSRILPILEKGENQLTIYPSGKGIVSANDVVIWCNLYPIWQENPDIINSLSSLKKWMELLHSKESFKKGLREIVKNVPGKALSYLQILTVVCILVGMKSSMPFASINSTIQGSIHEIFEKNIENWQSWKIDILFSF